MVDPAACIALLNEVRPRPQVSRPHAGVQASRGAGPGRGGFPLDGHAALEQPPIKLGANVRHPSSGTSVATDYKGCGTHAWVQVNVDDAGSKWLVLSCANLSDG